MWLLCSLSSIVQSACYPAASVLLADAEVCIEGPRQPQVLAEKCTFSLSVEIDGPSSISFASCDALGRKLLPRKLKTAQGPSQLALIGRKKEQDADAGAETHNLL